MIVASHRGPESFVRTGDGFERRRGAGGVIAALAPLVAGTNATWVAAAIDDDRAALEAGHAVSEDFHLRLLAPDPRVHRLHYQVISNSVLWFLHHGLFDLAHRPAFDERFREAWDAYCQVNEQFATTICEAGGEGDVVLVHDYHLALVPGLVRRSRPDLRTVFFHHTPFCGPNSIRVLPRDVAEALLRSMGTVPCGFHTPRWQRAYEASAREVLGADGAGPAFSSSLGPDPETLEAQAAGDDVVRERATVEEWAGDRRLVVRVDRLEPSKNIVRGFKAYDLMLARHPELRERVTFVALVYPSREGLPEYLAYRQQVEQAARRVNERWGMATWQPVVLDVEDCHPRSLAALRCYDVLLVNPIRDGMNLVAKEGPLLNERDGVLLLSPDAGAYEELGPAALEAHPYDVLQTAEALAAALTMDGAERAARAARLRELAAARTARQWFADLLAHAPPPPLGHVASP